MPIEVRELIIKTTVEKALSNKREAPQKEQDELKQDILKSCQKLITKALKNQHAR